MKLLMQTFLVIWWEVSKHVNAGSVPGTGWTDLTQLESTCSKPGYFVNPTDCSRFYVCVDHSTADNRLLLRYDFNCPGGLAFDESTKNCNYPGPSGCVTNNGLGGSGWGWEQQQISNSGIFQTAKGPSSWGAAAKYPAVGTTIVHVPSSSGTIVRGPSTPAPFPSNPRINLESTSAVGIPVNNWESYRLRPTTATRIIQSARLTEVSSTESGGGSGGWSPNSGVFQSAKVIKQQGSNTGVAWGASKVFPVDTGVFQTVRVTPAPLAEWETPQPFPQPVVKEPGSGWSKSIRITATPTPAPSNPVVTPSLGWEGSRITLAPQAPPVSWQKITQTHQQLYQPQLQTTQLAWNAPQATQFEQSPPRASNPSLTFIQSSSQQAPPSSFNFVASQPVPPSVNIVQSSNPPQDAKAEITFVQSNPPQSVRGESFNLIQTHPTPSSHQSVNFVQSGPPQDVRQSVHFVQPEPQQFVQPINPPASNGISVNQIQENSVVGDPTLNVPAGWENVRITQLPSGYAWQSSPKSQSALTRTQTIIASTPITPTALPPPATPSSLSHGDFGIIQQVLNEEQGQAEISRKSHIQLVYENNERKLAQQQSHILVPQKQSLQQINSQDPSNPIYEFVSPPGSGINGRIIVLYAPLNRGGKREVPVIEVEVEDDDGDDTNSNNESRNE